MKENTQTRCDTLIGAW